MSNSMEIWKSPPSLNCPRIEVSNLGRVRTKPFVVEKWNGSAMVRYNRSAHIYRIPKDGRGRYLLQGRYVGKIHRGHSFLVHRLVAECFVKNQKPNEYDFVFFKDGDVGNCRADNLMWGSEEELSKRRRGKRVKYTIMLTEPKNYIEIMRGLSTKVVGVFIGIGEVARHLGISTQQVSNAIKKGYRVKGCKIHLVRPKEKDQ